MSVDEKQEIKPSSSTTSTTNIIAGGKNHPGALELQQLYSAGKIKMLNDILIISY